MKSSWQFVLLLAAFSANAETDAHPDTSVDALENRTSAEIISFDPLAYPRRAMQQGAEGWVVIRLVVKPDGTTDDIEIVDSSIDDFFDNAAIASAKSRLYKPATSMGKPVLQGNKHVRSVFAFSNSDGGVSKSFLRSYRRASRYISEDKLEKAKDLIDELDGNEKKLLAEICYLDMLKSQYFSETGDKRLTLKYVERALVTADIAATDPIYFKLLRQAIVNNAMANNFQRSLEHYNTLLEKNKKLASDDPIHGYISQIETIISSDKHIVTEAEVSRKCKTCENPQPFWSHTLNRSHFSIDSATGQLNSIDIICENKIVSVAYQADMSWGVNRDAGECRIKVFGESGTSFRLIELPNKTY